MQKKILVVDDDFKFTSMIKDALEESGNKVLIAQSGNEALSQLKLDTPNLAIVDGQLPDTDGVTLIEKLRQASPDLHIIFVSAQWRDAATYLKLTGELKVSNVVHKPVPPVVLVGHIERLIGITITGKAPVSATQALASLSEEFAKELPADIDRITQMINKVKASPADTDSLQDARRHAHMLRGTCATYGFPEVGTQMGVVEDTIIMMQQKKLNTEEVLAKISDILTRARSNCASTAPTDDELEQSRKQRVLVVSQEKSNINVIRPMKQFFDLEHAYEKASVERAAGADGVIIRIQQNADLNEYFKLAASLRDQTDGKAAIAFWAQETIPPAHKLYLGLEDHVSVPPTLESLTDFANRLITAREAPSILVIDDDLNFVRKAEAVLSYEGMVVQGFQESSRVMEILEQFDPDLLLLDGDMPGLDGFEICKMLRQSFRWKDLPVVFCTGLTTWQARVSAFDAGADDFLAKPVVNAELIARVKTRLGRQLLKVDVAHFDQVTGLPVHRRFAESLNKARQKTPHTVAVIELANLDAVNASDGPAAGDRVLKKAGELLRRRFRRQDLRGRWSGAKLVLATGGIERNVLEESLKLFAQELNALFENSVQVKTVVTRTESGSDNLYKMLASLKETV